MSWAHPIIFGLLLVATAFGQAFQQLATNGDGSVLYFSCSLRLKGTDQYPYPKIFTWAETTGVQLYDQREGVGLGPSSGGATWSSDNAYRLSAPSVSTDGNVVAYTGTRDCNWGTPCAYSIEKYEATICVGATTIRTPGAVTLSPSGRFALLTTSIVTPGRPQTRLLDLQTGQQTEFLGFSEAPPFRRRVANDGTVVMSSGGLELWRAGERRTLLAGASVRTSMINASATRIVFDGPAPAPSRLILYDVETGRETELATASAPFTFSISDDASLIAYIDAGQAWIVRHDGSGRRHVAEGPDPVTDLTLSGDGRVLFATTGANRILRIELSSSTVEEIVPATAAITSSSLLSLFSARYTAPGSLFVITGENLPIVQQVRLGNRSTPPVSSSPAATLLQIPWEIPADIGWVWLEFELPGSSASPFQSSWVVTSPIWIRAIAPSWFRQRNNDVLAAHQDFSGLVTQASPARPGEILHLYGAGFGPVIPPVPSGEPAPLEPLSVLATPTTCELESDSIRSVEVLFAGLAPAMIGVYQLDLRLPQSLSRERGFLRCRVGSGDILAELLPLSPENQ
jgi:uncharacterized protein (TIGR03437 family)